MVSDAVVLNDVVLALPLESLEFMSECAGPSKRGAADREMNDGGCPPKMLGMCAFAAGVPGVPGLPGVLGLSIVFLCSRRVPTKEVYSRSQTGHNHNTKTRVALQFRLDSSMLLPAKESRVYKENKRPRVGAVGIVESGHG